MARNKNVMLADLECVAQGYSSYKISYFNYYMTDFNEIVIKMIHVQPVMKLVHCQLFLEIYVNVTVHKKTKYKILLVNLN